MRRDGRSLLLFGELLIPDPEKSFKSPLAVLHRGYSVARNETGDVITDASQLSAGQIISTQFAAGSAISRVEQVDAAGPETSPREQASSKPISSKPDQADTQDAD